MFIKHCIFRGLVLEILNRNGLRDPHVYFPRELDQWDVWGLDDDERPHELRRVCSEWLDK